MKLKKLTSILLIIITLSGICSLGVLGGYAEIEEQRYFAEISFLDGVGPETDGYTLDYQYLSPAAAGDTKKYPLVIWLHGMGNGSKPGAPLSGSYIANWGTWELQQRFKDSSGAFILIPRSLEDQQIYWEDCLIHPLRATIDDFIAKNKDNIDVSRIYIGGYSMGGKMTLKMAVAYPEMFAAAFPICPAWVPDKAAAEKIADMPIWLTSGKKDPLVNYYLMVKRTWKNIVSESNIPEICRFSTLSKTANPDGTDAPTGHHSWHSVNYDMFSSTEGDYPYMSTVDGEGNKVTLTYPDGMISWLSEKTCDYDGSPATDGGNKEAYDFTLNIDFLTEIVRYIKKLFVKIFM